MKNILFLLLLHHSVLLGQHGLYSDINVHSIGIHQQSKDSIYARDVAYPFILEDFKIDQPSGLLLLRFVEPEHEHMSNPGMSIHAVYDYTKNEFVWTNASKANKTYFNIVNNKIFFQTKDGSGLWDIQKKDFVWKVKSPLYIHADLMNHGLCIAPALREDGKSFCGIDIENGKVKWQISDFQVLGNVFHLPFILDSTLFFVNENLITVPLYSNKAQKHPYMLNTVAREGGGMTGAALLGGLLGVLIYEIADNAYSRGQVRAVEHFITHHSNFLRDSFVYIGTSNHLLKLDRNGREVTNALHYKSKTAGLSELFNFGGKKCLLNFGYNYNKSNRTSTTCSYFFIERFDDSLKILQAMNYPELKEKYYSGIDGEVIDYRVKENQLYLLFRNALIVLDTSFNIVSSRVIYSDEKWLSRLDQNFCYQLDSTFDCIDLNSNQNYFILNKNGSISQYSLSGDKVLVVPKSNLYYETYADEHIKVIGYKSDDYVLDKHHRLILKLPGIDKVLKNAKNYIIGFQSGFLIIDENQLIR